MKELDIEPLVSIIVIAYNSEKYILDCLESIKEQTYTKLELIITDDGSTDNTVEICNCWIGKNRERFLNVRLLTVEKNTGISPNCNRGFKAATGKWAKYIAGDDALLSSCINDNVNYIINNKSARFVHSRCKYYLNKFDDNNFLYENGLSRHLITHKDITASQQYQIVLRESAVIAPTVFVETQLIKEVEFFDEVITMIEDWPMWLNITKRGTRLHYINIPTTKYRVRKDSSSTKSLSNSFQQNQRFWEIQVYKKYIHKNITFPENIFHLLLNQQFNLSQKLLKWTILFKIVDIITSKPIRWILNSIKRYKFRQINKSIQKQENS